MRRIFSMLLVLALILGLAACGTKAEAIDLANASWEEILAAARGTTVTFYGWGGDENRNNWLNTTVADYVKENYDITLEVVGMNIGETKDVNVTFPEEYQAENLKGKPAVFAVKLNGIKAKELPELTDEFIKEATGSETVEAYKEKAKERLQANAERRANDATENSILEAIAANTEVEIPQVMIEKEIDGLVQKFEYQLMYQGLKLQDYLDFLKTTMADFRKNYEEQAKKNITSQLIISQLIKEENIEATEEEVDAKVAEQAASVGKETEEYKKNMDPRQFDYIRSDIIITKLFAMLKANNEMYVEE